MKTHTVRNILILGLLLVTNGLIFAQGGVAIGTTTLEDGAIFQLESDSKGLMLPKVSLTSRMDNVTVKAGPGDEGLWVYNTGSAGAGNNRVSPGHYFWDGDEWIRMYNEGYSVQFEQLQTMRAPDNSTSLLIPGLDQTIVAPYTGTYEIYVTGYIASPGQVNTSYPAAVTGMYKLHMDGSKIGETWVTSSTKKYGGSGGSFLALGQQGTIVCNVDLVEGQSYNFQVYARQWQQVNVSTTSLDGIWPGNYAFWGVETTLYDGNDLGIDNAQDAYMTITLIRQY